MNESKLEVKLPGNPICEKKNENGYSITNYSYQYLPKNDTVIQYEISILKFDDNIHKVVTITHRRIIAKALENMDHDIIDKVTSDKLGEFEEYKIIEQSENPFRKNIALNTLAQVSKSQKSKLYFNSLVFRYKDSYVSIIILQSFKLENRAVIDYFDSIKL